MGLDITVYKNIQLTNGDEFDFEVYVIDDKWRYKVKNLEYNGCYTGKVSNARVGYPYSSHNRFREILIAVIGRNDLLLQNSRIDWVLIENETEMPFYELINFADNEGCLDWEISEKLYHQFVEWKDRAFRLFGYDEYSKDKYLDWLEVFKAAKNKGVVVFG